MSEGVLARLRALLGDSGVAAGIDGTPRAMPESTEDVAEVMQLAHAEGWNSWHSALAHSTGSCR